MTWNRRAWVCSCTVACLGKYPSGKYTEILARMAPAVVITGFSPHSRVMPIFLVLFIVIPIAEMWLLIEVGSRIGALPTIGLVLLTAVIGLALLRQQGFATLLKAQQKMQAGQIPAKEMGEGIFLAVGGALLLTPGFITDFVGFCCLIPGLRHLLLGQLLKRWSLVQFHRVDGQGDGFYSPPRNQGRETLDGEYRRED